MVLDNASTSNSSDAVAYYAPADDTDQYADPQEPGDLYKIDTTGFPKPIPVLGRLLGYDDQLFAKNLHEKIRHRNSVLGRHPTQEEANALGYYLAKQISIYSYGGPAGFAAGLWAAYNSRNTFRFAFYQPNLERFQPDVFPPRLGWWRGNNARLCWHAARTSSYVLIGMMFSRFIFASYAGTVAAVGELSDPRLKEVTAAIHANSQQRKGSLQTMQQGPAAEKQFPNRERQAATYYGSDSQDDASPTGGMFGEENTTGSPGNPEENMAGSKQNEGQWPTSVAPSPAPRQAPKETEETFDTPFDAWDDASPTGGQGVTNSAAQTPQGSAWDRLRRGDKPNPISPKSGPKPPQSQNPWTKQQNETQREQRQGSTVGDSFAFSKSEEERAYAKEEAQKDFDARVERERAGGDFSKGGGDQRRW
jgi:hypothetical protein